MNEMTVEAQDLRLIDHSQDDLSVDSMPKVTRKKACLQHQSVLSHIQLSKSDHTIQTKTTGHRTATKASRRRVSRLSISIITVHNVHPVWNNSDADVLCTVSTPVLSAVLTCGV